MKYHIRRQWLSLIVLGIWSVCMTLPAHEGHDMPGALPPPPHGGVVAEASHKGAHNHDAKADELFFEAVYKDKKLSLYPLALGHDNTSAFMKLSPKNLGKVEVKVEMPRAKKIETLIVSAGADALEAAFDAKGANRFIVHIALKHNNETKAAKIQIEKK